MTARLWRGRNIVHELYVPIGEHGHPYAVTWDARLFIIDPGLPPVSCACGCPGCELVNYLEREP